MVWMHMLRDYSHPAADLPLLRPFGPRAGGDLDDLLGDVDEAGHLEPVPGQGRGRRAGGMPAWSMAVIRSAGPAAEPRRVRHGAVVAARA